MATAQIVTITPYRLRFLVNAEDEAEVIQIPASTLIAAAQNPMKQILGQTVTTDDAAKRLLLGIGQPLSTFQPNLGNAYCRVRIHVENFTGIDCYCGADAAVDPMLNQAILLIRVDANNATTWVLDLEVEHTLTR